MSPATISCESCDRTWAVLGNLSLYERQAMESRPCPFCAAYTLCCPDLDDASCLGPRRGIYAGQQARVALAG